MRGEGIVEEDPSDGGAADDVPSTRDENFGSELALSVCIISAAREKDS